jgi:hypothetical protein
MAAAAFKRGSTALICSSLRGPRERPKSQRKLQVLHRAQNPRRWSVYSTRECRTLEPHSVERKLAAIFAAECRRLQPDAATFTGFARDSPLEEGGFELLVPRVRRTLTACPVVEEGRIGRMAGLPQSGKLAG